MPEQVVEALETLAKMLEIVGAVAMIAGFIVATIKWLLGIATLGAQPAFEEYRQLLARVVLVGLEILVAATIIKTITIDPTLESLGLLACMVFIRTMLGWTMVLEMTGRWPWQGTAPANA